MLTNYRAKRLSPVEPAEGQNVSGAGMGAYSPPDLGSLEPVIL